MTLSALRAKLTLQLASLHVRGHQDKHCEFELLTRPQQLNVLATEVLERIYGQPTNLLSCTRYQHPAPTYGIAQGTSQATKNALSRMNFRSTKSERTSNSTTVGMHTP
jgi:hypothetical protein